MWGSGTQEREIPLLLCLCVCVWFLVAENEERGRGDSGRMEGGGFPQTEGRGRGRYLPLVSLGLSLFSLALPHCANKQELGSGIGFSYYVGMLYFLSLPLFCAILQKQVLDVSLAPSTFSHRKADSLLRKYFIFLFHFDLNLKRYFYGRNY